MFLLENYNDTVVFEILDDYSISPVVRVIATGRHSIITSKKTIFMVGDGNHMLYVIETVGQGSP